MLEKTCSYCSSRSYGSSDDVWICPNCDSDITELPCVVAKVCPELPSLIKNIALEDCAKSTK